MGIVKWVEGKETGVRVAAQTHPSHIFCLSESGLHILSSLIQSLTMNQSPWTGFPDEKSAQWSHSLVTTPYILEGCVKLFEFSNPSEILDSYCGIVVSYGDWRKTTCWLKTDTWTTTPNAMTDLHRQQIMHLQFVNSQHKSYIYNL